MHVDTKKPDVRLGTRTSRTGGTGLGLCWFNELYVQVVDQRRNDTKQPILNGKKEDAS